jgi:small subunit ribosomal protein S16
MLVIRLQRIGKRGQAYFRVIVVEHTKKPKGEYLELLGTYNPHEKVLKVKKDRVEYWISKGAQASPTVNNLLVNYKIWDKPKVQSWKPKVKPKTAEAPAAKPAVPKEEPTEAQPATQ